MGLKEQIEQADRLRRAQDFANKQRVANDNQNWETKQRNEMIRQEGLKVQARRHFNNYLLPIFREVSAAKNIPLRERSQGKLGGLFGGKSTSWFSTYDDVRDIFNGEVVFGTPRGNSPVAGISGGDLVWDYKEDGYTRSWRHLQLEVTDTGLIVAEFCPKGTNVLENTGQFTLASSVEKVMVEKNGLEGWTDNTPTNTGGW